MIKLSLMRIPRKKFLRKFFCFQYRMSMAQRLFFGKMLFFGWVLFKTSIVILYRCHILFVLCLMSPGFGTHSLALHKHAISDVLKRLATFASLPVSTLASMFFVLCTKISKSERFYFFGETREQLGTWHLSS